MKLIYFISVKFYSFIILLLASVNSKAKKRINGLKEQSKNTISRKEGELIWFHCASTGEFEQARPLIEKIKKENKEAQILISFFSPSGFELRKNYNFADFVIYLPNDSTKNARNLIQKYKPTTVFFIKYEFWHYYLSTLKKNNIKVYLVSGIFRKNQIFFKFYGGFYRKILQNFEILFVQNKESEYLLNSIGIKNVQICGDTRFDRVTQISKTALNLPEIEIFKQNNKLIIAGSTWEEDEKLFVKYINQNNSDIKYIIVPHEIKTGKINSLQGKLSATSIKYSEIKNKDLNSTKIIIIDNVGMLSSLYKYADIAYIGGGFGKGIHNTLEAAVYGIPIIFGKKYQKFEEAKQLIARNAAFSISNFQEFNTVLDEIITDENFRHRTGKNSIDYVQENIGAVEKIFKTVSFDVNY